jgi:hypothetical protein
MKEYKFHELILEQIDDSGENIVILNLLGTPLYRNHIYTSLEEWTKDRCLNYVRTERFAHVAALMPGDVLINGDKVDALPREGGNGDVLLRLRSNNGRPHWFSYPGARAVLALAGAHDGPLPDTLLA